MKRTEFKAAILDMDGVITRTADVHARAWRQMFDDYLQSREQREGESHEPFDADRDYRRYVDGKPRYDGVKSFLASRGIELPHGSERDAPTEETVCGLGNRKNAIFRDLVEQGGVEAYEDTVQQVEDWRRSGLKVAVISSSRNCEAILKAVGLLDAFDAKVDGNDSIRLGLAGKPAPDVFLQAAQEIGVEPRAAIVVEDAIAGVQAGRRGGFGMVVGVARGRETDDLRQAGADRVVHDLRELRDAGDDSSGHECLQTPVSAIEHSSWIARRLQGKQLALFLDYDGTLTPIVRRPEDATLSDEMRSLLSDLARLTTVAIVSGRDRPDVEAMVAVGDLAYAGSHGFDIRGPRGVQMQQQDAQHALPELDEAEQQLRPRVEPIDGARMERKKFAIAVHFREVGSGEDVKRLERAVDEVIQACPGLRKRGGKKIFELQPDVQWDKGHAVLWLTDALGVDHPGVVVIYIGDDVTDEDAFRVLRYRGTGVGIRVGAPTSGTHAAYFLRDCDEVRDFLKSLLMMFQEESLSGND